MERIDLLFKAAFGFVGSFISWMVGGLGLVFVVLLGLMVMDFATGIMAGITGPGLSSSKGRNGFIRKLYIIILIGAVYLIEITVLKSSGVVGDGVAIAYCVIEFISIVENGGKLGVPLGPVQNIIEVLKGKEKGEKINDNRN
ncbi:phage holin family protein [Paenibacillus apiarius]|uniref:phage holin family protein n=1 Tax=Paenibacillus apiarius TaxID=46240 RepID=UPI003B3A2EB1